MQSVGEISYNHLNGWHFYSPPESSRFFATAILMLMPKTAVDEHKEEGGGKKEKRAEKPNYEEGKTTWTKSPRWTRFTASRMRSRLASIARRLLVESSTIARSRLRRFCWYLRFLSLVIKRWNALSASRSKSPLVTVFQPASRTVLT